MSGTSGGTAITARRATLYGALAGVASSFLMLALRAVAGAPSLPDLVSDSVIGAIPAPLFSALLDLLSTTAKPLLFVSLVLAQIAAGAAAGRVYLQWWHLDPDEAPAVWRTGPLGAAAFAVLGWLAVMLIVLPLTGSGFFGSAARRGAAAIAPAFLAEFLVYGLALFLLRRTRWQPTAFIGTPDPERRRLLSRWGMAAGGLAAAAALGSLTVLLARAGNAAQTALRPRDSLPPEVTPNSAFYIVSKNFVDPTINASEWKLEVSGLVERPLSLDYEALQRLPAVEQYTTLECISNPVGGDLMSNALWKGVRLRDILGEAGVRPGANELVFRCADGYSDSIPLEEGMEPATLLVYEMNGEPLPEKHGYPARLIVPGIYGMKNVKWVNSITLADIDYKGYWEQQGWSDSAVVKTTSRIDVPLIRVISGDTLNTGGVAFAGDRSIARVEVSIDGGQTWRDARRSEALSPSTWLLWTIELSGLPPGAYKVLVRATDGTGDVQTAQRADPFPDGASGLHSIDVRVVTA